MEGKRRARCQSSAAGIQRARGAGRLPNQVRQTGPIGGPRNKRQCGQTTKADRWEEAGPRIRAHVPVQGPWRGTLGTQTSGGLSRCLISDPKWLVRPCKQSPGLISSAVIFCLISEMLCIRPGLGGAAWETGALPLRSTASAFLGPHLLQHPVLHRVLTLPVERCKMASSG